MLAPIKRLLHPLWRMLPRKFRRGALFATVNLTAPRPTVGARRDFSHVIIAGVIGARSGLAQAALGLVRRIGETRSVASIDLAPAFLAGKPNLKDSVLPERGAMIIVINSPFMPFAMTYLGRRRLRDRYLVAHWSWELQTLPDDWRNGFDCVHEIWVSSAFMADAIRAQASCPVHVVPPTPADIVLTNPPEPRPDGSRLTVLVMFDMGSSLARKNPLAAIAAFRLAFADAPTTRLIVKMSNGEVYPPGVKAIQEAIAGAPSITLMTDPMDRETTLALIADADILLSTHRSEGFGLPLFEAMLLERVVVATGWSANTEFMNDQNAVLLPYELIPAFDPQDTYTLANAKWADVDIDAAATALRSVADNAVLRQALGAQARRDALAFIARADEGLSRLMMEHP